MKQLITLCTLLVLPFILFAQELTGIDEIAPFSEGLAAIRKGNEWGFINKEGQSTVFTGHGAKTAFVFLNLKMAVV